MITVEQASEYLLQKNLRIRRETVPLGASSGRVTAEEMRADRDLPPYDRVCMDGIALQYPGCSRHRNLKIQSSQYAGEPAETLVDDFHCIEVMTGAVLPVGCNAVVPVELLEEGPKNSVVVDYTHTVPWANIHRKASDANKGQVLIPKGAILEHRHLNLLASIGAATVRVRQISEFAIISTGDELLQVEETPLPHQIRRSNPYPIHATLSHYGIPAQLYHLPDQKAVIEKKLKEIFQEYKHIILLGAVSKGKKDFVPMVLQNLDIEKVFHRVAQKPGKPFFFGRSANHTVYALPGNPYSAAVCTCRYLIPHIEQSLGIDNPIPRIALSENVTKKKGRTRFLPVQIHRTDEGLKASPLKASGSGDIVSLAESHGFLELSTSINELDRSTSKTKFKKGEKFPFYSYPDRRIAMRAGVEKGNS